MTASRSTWLVASSLIIVAVGCSGGAPAGPKTVPASGKVTYKNVPVEGATVSFLGDGKIAPAIAITDSTGSFVLTTNRSGDGAVPGAHRVTVTKIIAPPSTTKSNTGTMSMEDAAKAAKEPPPAKPLSMLPDRYRSAESSGLTYTVKQGDKNDFKIELAE
jgi:hypothetical protein